MDDSELARQKDVFRQGMRMEMRMDEGLRHERKCGEHFVNRCI
jgi:hypothetical protein